MAWIEAAGEAAEFATAVSQVASGAVEAYDKVRDTLAEVYKRIYDILPFESYRPSRELTVAYSHNWIDSDAFSHILTKLMLISISDYSGFLLASAVFSAFDAQPSWVRFGLKFPSDKYCICLTIEPFLNPFIVLASCFSQTKNPSIVDINHTRDTYYASLKHLYELSSDKKNLFDRKSFEERFRV